MAKQRTFQSRVVDGEKQVMMHDIVKIIAEEETVSSRRVTRELRIIGWPLVTSKSVAGMMKQIFDRLGPNSHFKFIDRSKSGPKNRYQYFKSSDSNGMTPDKAVEMFKQSAPGKLRKKEAAFVDSDTKLIPNTKKYPRIRKRNLKPEKTETLKPVKKVSPNVQKLTKAINRLVATGVEVKVSGKIDITFNFTG